MKKLISALFLIMMLLTVTTSCKNEDPAANKGELTSVIYDGSTKTFQLTYTSGYTNIVNATIIDNTATATLEDGTKVMYDDASNSGEATIITSQDIADNQYVNGWIYDEMSIYYLWNDKLSKAPDYTLDPEKFFDSILYKYHPISNPDGDRFSWIQDDYEELQDNLSGIVSDEIGFDYILAWADQARTHYYALVIYAKNNTDAKAKGVDRGRFITKINGQDINASNYNQLFGGTGSKTLSMADWVYNSNEEVYYLQNSGDVTINMHNRFAENPILMDSVYTIDDKKIGYLVYNFFARDRGNNSSEYDRELMSILGSHKSQGINEMVLDLRYNSGGAVSSAIALASALVKNRSTNNVLTTSEYNSIVHNSLIREFGANYNKDYFIDKVSGTNISIPEMNLPRLFILTSGWTASASEFIINGLIPYMDVILIGETTYGKNVGSITIYEEDDEKNKWGMQPIIVRYSNSLGNSDFTAGFNPDHEVDEFDELYLYDFGNSNDPLLKKALTLITGTTRATATKSITTPFRSSQINEKLSIEKLERNNSFEMYDDIRGDDIKRLMKK